jgi:hypothetical protein
MPFSYFFRRLPPLLPRLPAIALLIAALLDLEYPSLRSASYTLGFLMLFIFFPGNLFSFQGRMCGLGAIFPARCASDRSASMNSIPDFQGVSCPKCGALVPWLHRDHIVPKWVGGPDTKENIQMLCGNCHDWKTYGEQFLYPKQYHARIESQASKVRGKRQGKRRAGTGEAISKAQKERFQEPETRERQTAVLRDAVKAFKEKHTEEEQREINSRRAVAAAATYRNRTTPEERKERYRLMSQKGWETRRRNSGS